MTFVLGFHGASRDAAGYRTAASDAPVVTGNSLKLAYPLFRETTYPSDDYQRGGLTTGANTYLFARPMVEDIRTQLLGGTAETCIMWGYSAGGQYLSRAVAHDTLATGIDRIVIGAPSTYVWPSTDPAWPVPYGFNGRAEAETELVRYLALPLTIYVGDQDNDPADPDLSTGTYPDAMGSHRLARAQNFFAAGEAAAALRGVPFGWRYVEAVGIGHTHGGMIDAAQAANAFYPAPAPTSFTFADQTYNANTGVQQYDLASANPDLTGIGIYPLAIGTVPAQTFTEGTGGTFDVTDNFGGTITGWEISPTTSGITIAAGVVTVADTAASAAATDYTITALGEDGRSATQTASVTVEAVADTTPDAFDFTDQSAATVSTLYTSGWVQITGTDAAAAASVTGGEYRFADDGAGLNATAWTSAAGTHQPGQWAQVRGTSSASNSTGTDVALTIGGVTGTYTIMTEAADVTAPILSAASDDAFGATGYSGSVTTDEAGGTLYFAAYTGAAPTAAEVVAGTGGTIVAASAGSQPVTATGAQPVSGSGLTAATPYTLAFVHVDAAGNQSAVLSGDGFTTGAAETLTPVVRMRSNNTPGAVLDGGIAFSAYSSATLVSGSTSNAGGQTLLGLDPSADNGRVNQNTFEGGSPGQVSIRFGTRTHGWALPAGTYEVTIYFADNFNDPGVNLCSVSANGTAIVTDFDITGTFGKQYIGARSGRITTAGENVQIAFTNALWVGIEIREVT